MHWLRAQSTLSALLPCPVRPITSALFAALAWTTSVCAELPERLRDTEAQTIRRAVEAGQLKPLNDILALAQQRYAGRVVDVEVERGQDGNPLYRFRLLGSDGYRREVFFDAVTGQDVSQSAADHVRLKPLPEVLRALQARGLAGPVVEVELERWIDRRQVYEMRMPTSDGRLRELIVDAQTGQVVHDGPARFAEAQRLRPVAQVLDEVLKRYPGQVTEVEIEMDNQGRRYYEIELRTEDGRMLELYVDAVTGALHRAAELK